MLQHGQRRPARGQHVRGVRLDEHTRGAEYAFHGRVGGPVQQELSDRDVQPAGQLRGDERLQVGDVGEPLFGHRRGQVRG